MVVLTNNGILGCSESFCFYCGCPVREVKLKMYQSSPPEQKTADHVIPKSKGGTKIVIACYGCNDEKRDMTLDEYRLIRAFRAGKVLLPEYKFAAEERTENGLEAR